MTYRDIIRELKAGNYRQVYFLYGDESYYIDRITDYISDHVLGEEEKDFNQVILYGKEAEVQTIVETARKFPMMASHQVVVIKEAQHLRGMKDLLPYINNPQPTTILVFCYKAPKIDGRLKFFKELKKKHLVFHSRKLYDNKVPGWITRYLEEKNFSISPKASLLLADYLGNDLNKIAGELEKLTISLSDGGEITPELIERNIGISKEYNFFELQDALGIRNIEKANKIINHFAHNEKKYPLAGTVASLYYFYSRLLAYLYLPDKRNPKTVASSLQLPSPFLVKKYKAAASNYNIRQVVEVIRFLREYDLKAKGVGNSSFNTGELLKELGYKILHQNG